MKTGTLVKTKDGRTAVVHHISEDGSVYLRFPNGRVELATENVSPSKLSEVA